MVGAGGPLAQSISGAVKVFEQNLQGMTVETRDNQPRLDQSGWQNQISSIMVKSGTWDFYSEQDYGGQMVRLPPGQYANLEGWDKQISSFKVSAKPRRSWAHPVVANGRLYLREHDRIFCYDIKDGSSTRR